MNISTAMNIKQLIRENKILVFMKGEKNIPACKFSSIVIKILNNFDIHYNTINVLKNSEMREGIKIYSNWPTIPQIYINEEFIGGADIILDLYKNSTLGEILEKALYS